MVALTRSAIYKAILQTFNSPPVLRVLIPPPRRSSPKTARRARARFAPFQFLSGSITTSVYDFGKNSNDNA